MSIRCLVGLAVCSMVLVPTGRRAARASPSWARDARWYYVVVSRFHNGDASNDPKSTLPWSAPWPTGGVSSGVGSKPATGAGKSDLNAVPYGGDLKGLQKRLPYLKDLGINGLVLSPIFRGTSELKRQRVDWRHVDDTFGVRRASANVVGETLDPKTWTFSATDRVFLTFLRAAHEQGFRVLLEDALRSVDADHWAVRDVIRRERASPHAGWFEIDFGPPLKWHTVDGPDGKAVPFRRSADGLVPDVEKHLLAVAHRWMDPNGDGDPSDGVDGWVLGGMDDVGAGFWKRLRAHVKKINPEALLIGDTHGDASTALIGGAFDGRISRDVGKAVRRFFGGDGTYPLEKFFHDLDTIRKRHDLDTHLVTLNTLGGPDAHRLLGALSRPAGSNSAAASPAAAAAGGGDASDRWRLATIFQHFYLGAPITYYGDEVGMGGGGPPHNRAPMWWNDLPGGAAKPPAYRGDFFALIRLLNTRRGLHAPLRHGDCTPILLDEKRRLLAFSRSLPGDETILLMNYGNSKQNVKLTVGRPGQLIGLLSPQLRAAPRRRRRGPGPASSVDLRKIPELRMGASRQFVDQNGRISLWVKPRSVRIILVKDDVPN